MPPTITAEQVKGFSLWLLRAVMSGRDDALKSTIAVLSYAGAMQQSS